jgi:hypothetical protein
MLKIIKKSGLEGVGHASLFLYGPPGSGKTQTFTSAPGALILSAEGARGITGDVATIENPADMDDAMRFLRGSHPYQTVVVDGLNRLFTAAVTAAGRGTLSYQGMTSGKDPRQSYGIATNWLFDLVKELHEMPVLLLMTGHAKRTVTGKMQVQDFRGRMVTVETTETNGDLSPRIQELVTGVFDVVLYAATPARETTSKFTAHRLVRGEYGEHSVFAKDRFMVYGNKLLPLSWEHVAAPLGLPLTAASPEPEPEPEPEDEMIVGIVSEATVVYNPEGIIQGVRLAVIQDSETFVVKAGVRIADEYFLDLGDLTVQQGDIVKLKGQYKEMKGETFFLVKGVIDESNNTTP